MKPRCWLTRRGADAAQPDRVPSAASALSGCEQLASLVVVGGRTLIVGTVWEYLRHAGMAWKKPVVAPADKLDLVVFNGCARQYDDAPPTARVDGRVRTWVLAAGPNRGTSFHVVGGQFGTVCPKATTDRAQAE